MQKVLPSSSSASALRCPKLDPHRATRGVCVADRGGSIRVPDVAVCKDVGLHRARAILSRMAAHFGTSFMTEPTEATSFVQ